MKYTKGTLIFDLKRRDALFFILETSTTAFPLAISFESQKIQSKSQLVLTEASKQSKFVSVYKNGEKQNLSKIFEDEV